MTLDADEFIRRFLLHVLPSGFRRIRHYGFLANAHRSARLVTSRALLSVAAPIADMDPDDYRICHALLTDRSLDICPCCGGTMIEIAIFARPRVGPSPLWCASS